MTRDFVITNFIRPVLGEITGNPEVVHLFGKEGVLDSMGLLSLVVLLEEQVSQAAGKPIRLVSDSAFGAKSPFRTVDTLADYVVELVA